MAGWLKRADGPSLDCAETLEKLDSSGSWIDLDPFPKESLLKSEPDKLNFWFNKLLRSFLKETSVQSCFWPLPPMLGDGQHVNLFKLFLAVRDKGGYNAVSENGLWGLVSEESGLALNVASSVKLVYVKYLVSLERWLESIVQSEDSKSESNCSGNLMELGAELKGVLLDSMNKVAEPSRMEAAVVTRLDGGDKCGVKNEESMNIDLTEGDMGYKEVEKLQNGDNLKSVVVDSDADKKFIYFDEFEDTPSDVVKSVANSSDFGKICNEEVKSAIKEECVECKQCTYINDDDNVVILDSNDVKEKISSHKRKRDSMWGMLNWITEIAKDPCDPVVGSLPERPKWKSYGSEELWKQVLSYREAVFCRKDDHSSADQKNQKMHPSLYDDHTKLGYNLRERLSCTKKHLSGKMASKGQDWSPSSSLRNHSDLDSSVVGIDKQSATPVSVFDYDNDIHVPIGPYFQAEVPDWTGVASESDAKWLGTRVWPLEKRDNLLLIERDRIGKGRQDSCGCHIPNSLQCVKFHVAEKRSKVKLELGSAFNKWKFDKMGEEVAFDWKEEEQKKFMSIVKSNLPYVDKSFWDEIYRYFRNKSREELVCYYYNVFVLRRRAFQNRISPSSVNSDDEESGAESVTKRFGHVKPYTSILISPKKHQKKSRYTSSSKYGTP